MESFDYLISQVQDWAIDKGIAVTDDLSKQMLKVIEEVGETAGAIAKKNHEDIVDGIGDSFVTLIILCQQAGIDPRVALGSAYDVIAKRKGKTVNGVFIKDE
jgi:NTP pyrophosphatase (non-canonical NTP hydrolase)